MADLTLTFPLAAANRLLIEHEYTATLTVTREGADAEAWRLLCSVLSRACDLVGLSREEAEGEVTVRGAESLVELLRAGIDEWRSRG